MSIGKFIIIEGGDCSGKSTFMKFLKNKHPFPRFYYTNEPGGNEYGMKIRQLLLNTDGAEESDNLTKFHLYWASKVENFRREILPRLLAGQDVVSDRFEGSTFAYQVSEDYLIEELFWKTREVCFGDIIPTYLHFDVPVGTALARAIARKGESNYFDVRGVDYRNKVRQFYLRFFDDERIVSHRIDADVSPDEMLASAYLVFKGIVTC